MNPQTKVAPPQHFGTLLQEGTALYVGDCKVAQCLDEDAEELYGESILPREEYRNLLVPYDIAGQRCAYIAHANNNYPQLIDALQAIRKGAEGLSASPAHISAIAENALREAGEIY
jgi:hypothetical protein